MKRIFIFFLVLTFLTMVALQVLGSRLITPDAPMGIVSFELAGSPERAQNIMESWDATIQLYAAIDLGLDFLFLVAYSITLVLCCLLIMGSIKNRFFIVTGHVMVYGSFLAGLLDAVENYALIKTLFSQGNSTFPFIAKWCAIPKFTIVGLVLVYSIAGGIFILIKRLLKNP